MEKECVFCRIVAGEIPADILYQDKEVIAFQDIEPQAPTHVLVVPKSHIPSVAELVGSGDLMAHLIRVANELAEKEGIAASGYRLVINCGREGGQLVPHLHLHLLGGRKLSGTLG
jgi:histidine triad (HIT) family protein